MKKITVLSGKGGVGKSSITASIAVMIAKRNKIVVVDCDVDAPNLALILGMNDSDFDNWETLYMSEKAEVLVQDGLDYKKLVEMCNFNAITFKDGKVEIDSLKCEGCGVCQLLAPGGSIKLVKVNNGKIGLGSTTYGFKIVTGNLEMGESGSGKIVAAVRNKALALAKEETADFVLADAAAGIGCPVIASVVGSDYVVAVTEPTPSAFSDLKRALDVVNHFKIPAGIVINRYDINEKVTIEIEEFARENGLKIIGKIPYDKKFVESLVDLKPVVVYDSSYEKLFLDIINTIEGV